MAFFIYFLYHIVNLRQKAMLVTVGKENFQLFPQKAMLWQRSNMLIVADAHFGKVNHFRKNGIPVPAKAALQNVETLVMLIQITRPARLLFLGDLFHSNFNQDWETIILLISYFPEVSFELVQGNHDVLDITAYEQAKLKLHGPVLEEPPFLFTHQPLDSIPENRYNLAGHIHPGIMLTGSARQSLTLPCFHFSSQQAVCPAFGVFTGLCLIQPDRNDRVFAIAENQIVQVT
jgi:DNA ligase-associated metallophosphoesterase